MGCIATPEVKVFALTDRDRCLLLGCDGFWGVMKPAEVAVRAGGLLGEGLTPKAACQRLLHEAVREKHCKDNCTVAMVVLGAAKPASS